MIGRPNGERLKKWHAADRLNAAANLGAVDVFWPSSFFDGKRQSWIACLDPSEVRTLAAEMVAAADALGPKFVRPRKGYSPPIRMPDDRRPHANASAHGVEIPWPSGVAGEMRPNCVALLTPDEAIELASLMVAAASQVETEEKSRKRLLEQRADRDGWIHFQTTPAMLRALDQLASSGLFGRDADDVAEQLLREKVRELELAGWWLKP
jgi:hypothetical protein